MYKRSALRLLHLHNGFQSRDHDTEPASMYGTAGWHYDQHQVMAPPNQVNRAMPAPYIAKINVNRFRGGVWVDLDMHPAMREALAPYLEKLALTRNVPKNADAAAAAADYDKIAPLVGDEAAKLSWLAKILQLCGFTKQKDVAVAVWTAHCQGQFLVDGAPKPPVNLILGALFAMSACDAHAECKAIFAMCGKDGWNLSPHFPTSLWGYLLGAAGRADDAALVRSLLEEMQDTQVSFDVVDKLSLVRAFNALADKDSYNFAKQFLFNISVVKVNDIAKEYTRCRSFRAESLVPPLPDNADMYYHMTWHHTVRAPQQFSPRQLYFNFKPSFLLSPSDTRNQTADDIVKTKIKRWKEEGLLPEDYEYDGAVVDNTARFRNVMRHEHWNKMPKILKDKRYGYCGEH